MTKGPSSLRTLIGHLQRQIQFRALVLNFSHFVLPGRWALFNLAATWTLAAVTWASSTTSQSALSLRACASSTQRINVLDGPHPFAIIYLSAGQFTAHIRTAQATCCMTRTGSPEALQLLYSANCSYFSCSCYSAVYSSVSTRAHTDT